MTRSEIRTLTNHAVRRIKSVRDAGRPRRGAIADGVVGSAQLIGLGSVQGTDRDGWRAGIAQELVGRRSEQHYRGDVTGHLRRQRLGYGGGELCGDFLGHGSRRDEAGYDGALGIAAEHHSGVRTIGRRGFQMSAGVRDPVDDRGSESDAAIEIAAGWVIDRIHPDRLAADSRSQRVDESLPDSADSRGLAGTAGEHHLHVRTGGGGHDGDGCADHARPGRCHGGPQQTGDSKCAHRRRMPADRSAKPGVAHVGGLAPWLADELHRTVNPPKSITPSLNACSACVADANSCHTVLMVPHDLRTDDSLPAAASAQDSEQVADLVIQATADHRITPTMLGQMLVSASRSIADEDDLLTLLQHVCEIAHDAVDGADSTGVTIDLGGRVYTAVHTDQRTLRVDTEQYDAGQGPCLDASRTRTIVLVDSDDAAATWPRFAAAARDEGILSFLAAPLFTDDQTLGSLNLYGRSRSAFDNFDAEILAMLTTAVSRAIGDFSRFRSAREVLVMGARSEAAATACRCDEKRLRLWPWTEIQHKFGQISAPTRGWLSR